ncbi:MAG TPA: MXAN_5187 family protein [Kofleriaceae bacterium]|nr:MXAN_5187 family protein [Kofleriaceae bacterium]
MFLSKIWFFLVALAAAAALTVALVMPRPAQRQIDGEEKNRLGIACSVIDIVLADNARSRVALAGSFARAPKIVSALEGASGAANLDESRMKTVRDVAAETMKGVSGHAPDFAMLVDSKGRVVARVALDEGDFGDVVAGRPLVDDALAGYLRDDIWAQNGTMYLVSAAPVIRRDPPVTYVGAIVLGNKVTNELAKTVVGGLDVDVGFYLGNDDVASSRTVALDHAPMMAALGKLSGGDLTHDCRADNQFAMRAGNEDFTAVVGRLPGEAEAHEAFFTVFMKKRAERGFMGSLGAVQKTDVTFGKFPWILVIGVFVIALGAGIALMWLESDRPLKRLQGDALRLAKAESERLAEDAHGGRYGSIARSVNIHIDKLGRDAKSARTNLDQLLGPAPEGSLGTIDLLAGALPVARPGGAAPISAPPPSDFKFHDPAPPPVTRSAAPTPGPMSAMASRPSVPPPRAATPPRGSQMPAPRPPTPMPIAQQTQPLHLDDDILAASNEPSIDPYFKQVYDQFLAVKKSCGEPTAGLTYGKFSEKLVKNRDDLMAKTGCREVRFTVYVKDGKAALKATPVKDEAQ